MKSLIVQLLDKGEWLPRDWSGASWVAICYIYAIFLLTSFLWIPDNPKDKVKKNNIGALISLKKMGYKRRIIHIIFFIVLGIFFRELCYLTSNEF